MNRPTNKYIKKLNNNVVIKTFRNLITATSKTASEDTIGKKLSICENVGHPLVSSTFNINQEVLCAKILCSALNELI